MAQYIVGVFLTRETAEDAINDLQGHGFNAYYVYPDTFQNAPDLQREAQLGHMLVGVDAQEGREADARTLLLNLGARFPGHGSHPDDTSYPSDPATHLPGWEEELVGEKRRQMESYPDWQQDISKEMPVDA